MIDVSKVIAQMVKHKTKRKEVLKAAGLTATLNGATFLAFSHLYVADLSVGWILIPALFHGLSSLPVLRVLDLGRTRLEKLASVLLVHVNSQSLGYTFDKYQIAQALANPGKEFMVEEAGGVGGEACLFYGFSSDLTMFDAQWGEPSTPNLLFKRELSKA